MVVHACLAFCLVLAPVLCLSASCDGSDSHACVIVVSRKCVTEFPRNVQPASSVPHLVTT